jgi:hypothetical protein
MFLKNFALQRTAVSAAEPKIMTLFLIPCQALGYLLRAFCCCCGLLFSASLSAAEP